MFLWFLFLFFWCSGFVSVCVGFFLFCCWIVVGVVLGVFCFLFVFLFRFFLVLLFFCFVLVFFVFFWRV